VSEVVVYATPTCPWSRKTRRYLAERGVPFRELDVERDHEATTRMVRATGRMRVSVVEVGGEWIVGYDPRGIERALARRAAQGET
jgi:glutaredoxin